MCVKKVFISLFMVLVLSAPLFAASVEIPYLDRDMKIVLSDDFRELHPYQWTASIIPHFSFMSEIISNRSDTASSGRFMTFLKERPEEGVSLFDNMMSDVARPLSAKYLETEDDLDDTLFTQPSLYADISSAVLSYFLRHLTKDTLDVVLLTPDLDEPSEDLITGIEVGFRLTPTYGLRVKVRDNETTPAYGMQLEIFPNQNTTIKLTHEDNETEKSTGVELNLNY